MRTNPEKRPGPENVRSFGVGTVIELLTRTSMLEDRDNVTRVLLPRAISSVALTGRPLVTPWEKEWLLLTVAKLVDKMAAAIRGMAPKVLTSS